MSFRSDKTSVVLPFPGRKPGVVTPPGVDPPLPVLVVLHQETSQPGRVGNALRALGTSWTSGGRDLATPCPKRWMSMPVPSSSAAR